MHLFGKGPVSPQQQQLMGNDLGRLPGDIRIEKENFSFFFPLGTCLLVSLLLSLLLWLFKR
jgi:hypothetical protein